jgi:hypothetical protein
VELARAIREEHPDEAVALLEKVRKATREEAVLRQAEALLGA